MRSRARVTASRLISCVSVSWRMAAMSSVSSAQAISRLAA